MKTIGRHEFLSIDDVELDTGNPRIAKFLEMYSGEPTAEQLFIALGAGGDEKETETGPTFNKLKQSIITNGGIIQPIFVNRSADPLPSAGIQNILNAPSWFELNASRDPSGDHTGKFA